MCVCVCVCVFVCVRVGVYVCAYACVYVCEREFCVCSYACACAFLQTSFGFACWHVYIYMSHGTHVNDMTHMKDSRHTCRCIPTNCHLGLYGILMKKIGKKKCCVIYLQHSCELLHM